MGDSYLNKFRYPTQEEKQRISTELISAYKKKLRSIPCGGSIIILLMVVFAAIAGKESFPFSLSQWGALCCMVVAAILWNVLIVKKNGRYKPIIQGLRAGNYKVADVRIVEAQALWAYNWYAREGRVRVSFYDGKEFQTPVQVEYVLAKNIIAHKREGEHVLLIHCFNDVVLLAPPA